MGVINQDRRENLGDEIVGDKYRGELLICASKHKVQKDIWYFLSMWSFQGGLAPLIGKPLDLEGNSWLGVGSEDLNFGMAIAIVDLIDCKKTDDMTLSEIGTDKPFGNFSLGRYAWKLRLKEAIEPFAVKGKQGFFDVYISKVG